jgi:hypothetical protein
MQRENASICEAADLEVLDSPALGEPDDDAGWVLVVPSCAT